MEHCWLRRVDVDVEDLVLGLLEIFGEFLLEWLFGLGAEALSGLVERKEQDHPTASAIKLAGAGGAAGLLSAWMLPQRLITAHVLLPGVSALLAPLATGLAMHLVGKRLRHLGRQTSSLSTFWGGAIFALSMALIRLWLVGAPH